MKTLYSLTALISLSLLTISSLYSQHIAHADHDHDPQISFVENKGQWHQNVLYRTSLGDLNGLFLEQGGFTYLFHDADDSHLVHDTYYTRAKGSPIYVSAHAYRVRFKGAQESTIRGLEKQEVVHSYFHGNDENKWASNVSLFHKIRYEDLYPGIDLDAYSEHTNFKYDFIVHPGAKINDIVLEYEGADHLRIDKEGHLVIGTSVETIKEYKPYAYQLVDGFKQEVTCNYVLKDNQLSFSFPDGYQADKILVIDPTVIAATLSGTSNFKNFGHTATFDNGGNIYTGGISFGPGYPATTGALQLNYGGGATDICISKYNSTGSNLIYATYIGGAGDDYPHSIVADFNGQLYIYGTSSSIDYPTTQNAFQPNLGGDVDIIVTKLNSTGTAMVGSTYVGGSDSDGQNAATLYDNYGDSFRGEIIVDAQGNAYVASNTESSDFPVTADAYDTEYNPFGVSLSTPDQDAVVFKLNSDISTMYWATFLGEDDSDTGAGLRLDNSNNVYVTGIAGAENFPTTAGTINPTFQGGAEDAYVALISSDGKDLLLSTFWGTDDSDHGMFIDIDEDNNVHIYGQSKGDILITPNTYFYEDGSQQFLTGFNSTLDQVVYSTVIGLGPTAVDNYDFAPVAFMVDKCNHIYFSGYYASPGLPVSDDAISTEGNVFYLGVLEPNATDLSYGTYYGKSDHVDGGTSRFDKSGTVYQGVCSCNQGGVNNVLNTTANAWATTQSTACDVGVFKIDFEIETVTAAAQAIPGTSGCAPFDVSFIYTGQDATSWLWDFGDGTPTSTLEDPSHIYPNDGTYTVQLIAKSEITCNIADTFYIQIDVLEEVNTSQDTALCSGSETLYLDAAINNGSYIWQDGSTSSLYSVTSPGTYWVEVSIEGCSRVDTFHVFPASDVFPNLGDDIQVCDEPTINLDGITAGAVDYLWSTGSSNTSININSGGTYWVNVTDDVGCITSDTITIQMGVTPDVELGQFDTLCFSETVTLDATTTTSNVTYQWQDNTSGPTYTVMSSGTYSVTVENNGCPNTDDVTIVFYEIPQLEFQTSNIVCTGECNGFIETTIVSSVGPLDFQWDTGSTDPNIYNLCEGTYNLTVTDQNGCTLEETFNILDPDPLSYDFEFGPVICFGDANGFIEITNISGGFPPYTYSLNGGTPTEDPYLDGLSGGTYVLMVSDAGGCTLFDTIQIYEPPFINIFAGDDRHIELGDTVHVNGFVFPIQNQILNWDPLEYFLGCVDCAQPEVQPIQSVEYILTVEDSITGCIKMDTVYIQVDKTRKIYIPNAFTANFDGINDYFMVYSGPGVSEILSFKIYDRWGEQLFQQLRFQPNDRTYGWDGTFKGQDMDSGVFVYVVEVEFIDGVKILYSGDVTLLK